MLLAATAAHSLVRVCAASRKPAYIVAQVRCQPLTWLPWDTLAVWQQIRSHSILNEDVATAAYESEDEDGNVAFVGRLRQQMKTM